MSDEEQKKDSAEEPQETPTDDSAAAPLAEDSASSQEASSEPAAEETPEEAPSEEAAPDAEQQAEAPPAEPSEEEQLPWKERRRLEKSRRPHRAGPQLSSDELAAKRTERRRGKALLRRKQRAAARAEGEGSATGTPPAERRSNAAKVRQGVVVSDKAEKSITVRVDIVRRHPVYEKVVHSSRTLHAHDERNEANEGDVVRVVETRPLSKTKRWRLVDIVEKAR